MNASHISTFCSYVDLLRPEYGILENVVSMGATRKGLEDQNVLSQLTACLVGMGYQVNEYIMDSWNYGSIQQRSRIILTVAAPGLDPIIQPQHTHSLPKELTANRSLGKIPNGQPFGERQRYATPFPHVSPEKVLSNLPDIGNGSSQTCIQYPDHRLPKPTARKDQARLECIPIQPPGCGYKEAHKLGLIPLSLQMPGKETGKAFRRVEQAGLVPCLTTTLNVSDSFRGASVHWREHRPLSILEARRIQGYLDHEVIVGSLNKQLEIIGNGVDRKCSTAIGLAIRQTLAQSMKNGNMPDLPAEPIEEMLVDAEQNQMETSDASLGNSATKVARSENYLFHMSDIITKQLERMTLRSRGSLPSSALVSVQAKRSREVSDAGKISRDDHTGPRKLFKSDTFSVETKTVTRTETKTRFTRSSGREVILTPKQWNRRPERLHSQEKIMM
jgi:DNA (cytosine-5)-methyltransferase 1